MMRRPASLGALLAYAMLGTSIMGSAMLHPSLKAIMAAPGRTVRKPRRIGRVNLYPELNRARRHPPADSYAHAARISTVLGKRDRPLR